MQPAVFLTLMTIHFVADFLMQSHWMATNKSKSMKALLAHTGSYSVVFLLAGWKFALTTFLIHTATDFITSRITSRLWARQSSHWFFVVIGADQLSHTFQLVLTYVWLRPL